MEFHKNSIPWNSGWYWDMKFNGILRKHNLWNSMEFHKSSTPYNSVLFWDFEVPEKVSMDFHRKLVFKEFRTTTVKISLQPLIFTELDKDFITYNICTVNNKRMK